MNLKKGAQVKIISGKDKGKTGEILEINRKLEKIKIKSISMIKKHTKPTKENKGGIISKESFIHQSNVKNIDIKKSEKKVINKKLGKLKIKSINMIKRHTKPTKENKGGIISKESFIHQSNVKNIDIKKSEKKIASKK